MGAQGMLVQEKRTGEAAGGTAVAADGSGMGL